MEAAKRCVVGEAPDKEPRGGVPWLWEDNRLFPGVCSRAGQCYTIAIELLL